MIRKSVPSVAVHFLSIIFLFNTPAAVAAVHSVADDEIQGEKASPASLLNPDGTLKLDGSYSGALDLDGWQVDIDPEQGPVFTSTLISDWSSLGSGSGGGSLNHHVQAIAVTETYVYVGGVFTDVNDNGTVLPEADYIARWNGANWSALGSNGAGNGAINNEIFSIAVSGTDIYVGGWFENVSDNGTELPEADFVARWDGDSWSALGSDGAGDGSLNGGVEAVAVSGTDVYAGGYFQNVNDNGTVLPEADSVARWDGDSWSALGSNGAGNGALSDGVLMIAINGADVYVGGMFTDVNSNGSALPTADHIARWDGSSWSALGSDGAGDGALGSWVQAIAFGGTDVYVGGSFTDVNNNGIVLAAADFVARYGSAAYEIYLPISTNNTGG